MNCKVFNKLDLIALVSLARRGLNRHVISNQFKLDDATEVLKMLKEQDICGIGGVNNS
jgi:hypothetical protein